MTPFERMAIFTMIESIEGQLRGLKTLLAAGSQVSGVQGKSTVVPQYDPMNPNQLTEQDEDAVAAALGLRDTQVAAMAQAAGQQLGNLWKEVSEEQTPQSAPPDKAN